MLYPIPLSTGAQLALGIAINLLAIVLLWGPFFYLRRRYKNKSHIPFRSRLITFLVFAVLFALFWWGYLSYDAYVWATPGKEWIHEFLGKWLWLLLYANVLLIPLYLNTLLYSKKEKLIKRLFVITAGIIISFIIHFWLIGNIVFKGLIARLS